MEFFLSRGYAPEHASGIVANLIHESGLDHTIGTGDQGNAYGLAQWNIEGSPERYSNFEKIFNKSLYESTFEEQLEYIDWELNNTEKRAMSKLLETSNPMDAALVVSEFYERPYGARGRNIEQIREQYRKEAEKGIKAHHHNPKREQQAVNLYFNYDDNIYAIDSNGNYVTLNPNVATEQDIQNSGVIKKQFYNEYLTNLQGVEKNTTFEEVYNPDVFIGTEEQTPTQNIINNHYYNSEDTKEDKKVSTEVEEAKNILDERQFLVGLIQAGAFDLQNPEYKRVPTMQDGGQIPTSSQGLYEYPNQTVKVPTKDGKITMKNIPYPVVGISQETGEQILMYPGQEYQFKNTKNVIEIPLSHYNTNKNMKEGGRTPYGTTVPILQADGSVVYENVRRQGYTFANGGYVNGFQNGGEIDLNNDNSQFKKEIKFYNDYLQSPMYKQRLEGMGWKNPEQVIKDRLNNLNTMNIYRGNFGDVGSQYLPETNKAYVNNDDIEKYKSTIATIAAHEISHGIGSRFQNNEANDPNLRLNNNERRALESRNNFQGDWTEHDAMHHELKADIDSMRYLLNRDGIYDTKTQEFKKSHLNSAKQKYSKDPFIKRIFDRVKDEDLIWIMNNIASVDNKNNNQFA